MSDGKGKAPATRKKRQRRDLKGPGAIALPHRSEPLTNGATRVGLLSWSQRYTQSGSQWTDNDLIATLNSVRMQRELNADLILCSGVSFYSEANENDSTTAQRITTASGGCPVLMEWPDDAERNEWWLADGHDWHLVRCDQYVKSAKRVGSGGNLVLAEIEAGFGRLRIGTGPTLLLLICNEARILGRGMTTSVLSQGVVRPSTGVPSVFSDEWVLLHPSHRPHANRSHHRGWDLLGKTKVNGNGLFQCVTGTASTLADGTRGPQAVLHAGPWQPGVDWQERASVSKFANGSRRRPKHPTRVSGLVEIRYAEFEV